MQFGRPAWPLISHRDQGAVSQATQQYAAPTRTTECCCKPTCLKWLLSQIDHSSDHLRGRQGLLHAQAQITELLIAWLALTTKDLHSVLEQPSINAWSDSKPVPARRSLIFSPYQGDKVISMRDTFLAPGKRAITGSGWDKGTYTLAREKGCPVVTVIPLAEGLITRRKRRVRDL